MCVYWKRREPHHRGMRSHPLPSVGNHKTATAAPKSERRWLFVWASSSDGRATEQVVERNRKQIRQGREQGKVRIGLPQFPFGNRLHRNPKMPCKLSLGHLTRSAQASDVVAEWNVQIQNLLCCNGTPYTGYKDCLLFFPRGANFLRRMPPQKPPPRLPASRDGRGFGEQYGSCITCMGSHIDRLLSSNFVSPCASRGLW